MSESEFENMFDKVCSEDGTIVVYSPNQSNLICAAGGAKICRSNAPLPVIFAEQLSNNHSKKTLNTIVSGFGDASVAEINNSVYFCEGLTLFGACIVLRGRLMSPLAESTRAISFENLTIPLNVGSSTNALVAKWFDLYLDVKVAVEEKLRRLHKEELQSNTSKLSDAIEARALDYAREFLSLRTPTRFCIQMNDRVLVNKAMKWSTSEVPEIASLGDALKKLIREKLPCYKRSLSDDRHPKPWNTPLFMPTTKSCSEKASVHVAFHSQELVFLKRTYLSLDGRVLQLEDVMRLRKDRHSDMPASFEDCSMILDFQNINLGDARDYLRHRLLSYSQVDVHLNLPTPSIAVDFPELWETRGFDKRFAALWKASVATNSIHDLPMAAKTSFRWNVNGRSLLKILELRTTPGTHPNVREIMIPLCEEVEHLLSGIFGLPEPLPGFFPDRDFYALGRLAVKKRPDQILLKEKEEQ